MMVSWIPKLLIGILGVTGVTAIGAGIYKLSSSNSVASTEAITQNTKEKTEISASECQIFFVKGSSGSEIFEKITLEELESRKYSNNDNFINDTKTACSGIDKVNKPNYLNRVYVTENSSSRGKKGVYSKNKQEILGRKHNSTIQSASR